MNDEDMFSEQCEYIPGKKERKKQIKDNSFFLKDDLFPLKLISIFQIIMFFYLFIHISTKENKLIKLQSHNSYIIVTIDQKGNQSFLGSKFNICPDEVYVNGIKTSPDNVKVLF